MLTSDGKKYRRDEILKNYVNYRLRQVTSVSLGLVNKGEREIRQF